jgi:transcriptional regulator with XRE-family HTH domain
MNDSMAEKRSFRPTYIKQWREYRGLSLRDLANRLPTSADGRPLVSHATIGRIENGLIAYTQPVVEALAEALGCRVSDLLDRNPKEQSELIDLAAFDADQKQQAIAYLEFLKTRH